MRRFVGVGYFGKLQDRDRFGLGTSWGSPRDKSLRDQFTSEVFYRIQLTRNLTISPDLQSIYQPSFTRAKQWIFLPGIRARIIFRKIRNKPNKQ